MRASTIVALLFLFACGDNLPGMLPSDLTPTFCGNGLLEADEQCDDDDQIKDSLCDATCHFTCGNGVVDGDVGELCDTDIASGPGSCPQSCDDNNACTDDVRDSSGCKAACLHSPITAPANGDQCCPTGANANNDSDCAPICGNSVVEPGESCDKMIAAGMPGACPTACSDGQVCTSDVLNNAGTCTAACAFPPITLPANGDGCCPAGANQANDSDCLSICGNGVREAGESCDTAIPSGPDACPTSCNDNNVCTTNVVGNPGTCQAVCVFPPITTPANGDGCCPAGANANNDNDCAPDCGNGVPEPGEQCDDGNMDNNDVCRNNCTLTPVAFRFSDLDVRDPHIFVNFFGCQDVTDNNPFFSVNNALQTSIQTDGNDTDTLLDLSPTLVFRQFSQTASTMPMELFFADCTAPMSTTSCVPGMAAAIPATATNMAAGQCLGPLPGTVRPYPMAVSPTNAPCFASNAVTVTLMLGGIPITLHDARIAGQYVGNPAGSLANGLLRGFISEADANATIIPASFPIIGGHPLSELLAGGANACPSHSDKDVNNGVTGWWFYLNFPAARVLWTD